MEPQIDYIVSEAMKQIDELIAPGKVSVFQADEILSELEEEIEIRRQALKRDFERIDP